MKKIIAAIITFSATLLLLTGNSYSAHDCPGGWKQLPNYKPGQGGACKMLGLNSRAGVCQPGYQYETLCDDASGGRYKTCQGPRVCSGGGGGYVQPPSDVNCRNWDYKRNRPCPSGYVNNDCIGTCESLPVNPQNNNWNNNNNCSSWDYRNNRPCPPGYVNWDCKGGCESR